MIKKSIFQKLSVGLSVLIGLILSFAPNALALESKSWSTDLDWDAWTKNGVTTVGNNQGLQLEKDPSTGAFKNSGEISYKYSPGGVNKWGKLTADSQNAPSISSNFIWPAQNNKNKVTQLSTETGAIKEWDVGVDPSRTAVGCNGDVWVANRSEVSVSHIIPSESMVVTRPLGKGYNHHGNFLRAIAVKCNGTTTESVWLGVAGARKVFKIDGTKFDQGNGKDILSDDPKSTLQIGPTVDINSSCVDDNGDSYQLYCPYGFAFGANSTYLYAAQYKLAVIKINTQTVKDDTQTIEVKVFKDTTGAYAIQPYGITNDSHGNIWVSGFQDDGDNSIARIDTHDKVVNFDVSGSLGYWSSVGIATSDQTAQNDGEKLALSFYSGQVCVIDIINNDTDSPALDIGNAKCPPLKYTGKGGGVAFDNNYDLWYVPRLGSNYVTKILKSTNYTTSEPILGASENNAKFYTYSDFAGNALANVNNSLKYEVSTDGSNWKSINSGEDIGLTSNDLYIKVVFKGGFSSPILKSLRIDYSSTLSSNIKPRILKTTYKSAADRQNMQNEEATFEKGETVYVRIKYWEPLDSRENVTIIDRYTNLKRGSERNFKLNDCVSSGNTILPDKSAPNVFKFNFSSLNQGLHCIDYEYVVE